MFLHGSVLSSVCLSVGLPGLGLVRIAVIFLFMAWLTARKTTTPTMKTNLSAGSYCSLVPPPRPLSEGTHKKQRFDGTCFVIVFVSSCCCCSSSSSLPLLLIPFLAFLLTLLEERERRERVGSWLQLSEPLSRKSLTEISLVDKNMPAYTLFVQTNRQATVMAVTQGMRLCSGRGGRRGDRVPVRSRAKTRDARGSGRLRNLHGNCDSCRCWLVGLSAVPALDSSFVGVPNFVLLYWSVYALASGQCESTHKSNEINKLEQQLSVGFSVFFVFFFLSSPWGWSRCFCFPGSFMPLYTNW